jgi:hypothetical protein
MLPNSASLKACCMAASTARNSSKRSGSGDSRRYGKVNCSKGGSWSVRCSSA